MNKFVITLAVVTMLLLGLNHYAETQITRAPTIRGDTFMANGFGLVIGHTSQLTIGEVGEFQVLGSTGPDSQMAIARFSNDSIPPRIRFLKSLATTIGVNAIVTDNDAIGQFVFHPDDGVDFDTAAARLRAEVDDDSPAAGDIGMAFIWEQMPGGGGVLAETMRLSAAGNLTVEGSIGTTVVTIDVDGGGGAEALAITSSVVQLTCTGAEVILTITGGVSGQLLTLIHEDTDCTLDDTDVDTANQLDLVGSNGDLVGAADLTIMLVFNGTHWLELARSAN